MENLLSANMYAAYSHPRSPLQSSNTTKSTYLHKAMSSTIEQELYFPKKQSILKTVNVGFRGARGLYPLPATSRKTKKFVLI